MEQNGPLLGGQKNIFRLSKSKERTRTYWAYFWMLCNMARRLALHFIELSSTESTIWWNLYALKSANLFGISFSKQMDICGQLILKARWNLFLRVTQRRFFVCFEKNF